MPQGVEVRVLFWAPITLIVRSTIGAEMDRAQDQVRFGESPRVTFRWRTLMPFIDGKRDA